MNTNTKYQLMFLLLFLFNKGIGLLGLISFGKETTVKNSGDNWCLVIGF
jgi:hypothetical protein